MRGIPVEIPAGAKAIVLAGNPNAGKSVVFNALTGMYVDVSNFPGTTLDISHGRLSTDHRVHVMAETHGHGHVHHHKRRSYRQHHRHRQGERPDDIVLDTPGVYGISSLNDEERVARDIILGADIVINVVNACHLERDLFLTQQVIDAGLPTIVVLNMVDEAEKNGIKVDHKVLASELGVPVIPAVAVEGRGMKELRQNIESASDRNDHVLVTVFLKTLPTLGILSLGRSMSRSVETPGRNRFINVPASARTANIEAT